MPQYQLERKPELLKISIQTEGSNQSQILSAFEDCQKGRCSCPTEEYKKLESMAVDVKENRIVLELKPRVNTFFDMNEIKKCLDFSMLQAK